MTAVAAARHDDLLVSHGTLTDGLVEARRKVTLVSLLFARFRSFVGCG
jgi:hypothetical protein